MARTLYSFSEQANLLGRPEGFPLAVREIEIAAGATLSSAPDSPAKTELEQSTAGGLHTATNLPAVFDRHVRFQGHAGC